eukprot:GHVU01190293.1.p1 GENE.GHVU01190293.1~~GHVU01190293.1.p1  ORF type:complete len:150 (-),score=5.39 GHVU01190293.1:1083-1532(-)
MCFRRYREGVHKCRGKEGGCEVFQYNVADGKCLFKNGNKLGAKSDDGWSSGCECQTSPFTPRSPRRASTLCSSGHFRNLVTACAANAFVFKRVCNYLYVCISVRVVQALCPWVCLKVLAYISAARDSILCYSSLVLLYGKLVVNLYWFL